MTASATERGAREGTARTTSRARLRIDFGTYEAFKAASEPPEEPPRIVRWMDCFARGEYDGE